MNTVDDEDMIDQQVDAKDHPVRQAQSIGAVGKEIILNWFIFNLLLFFQKIQTLKAMKIMILKMQFLTMKLMIY